MCLFSFSCTFFRFCWKWELVPAFYQNVCIQATNSHLFKIFVVDINTINTYTIKIKRKQNTDWFLCPLHFLTELLVRKNLCLVTFFLTAVFCMKPLITNYWFNLPSSSSVQLKTFEQGSKQSITLFFIHLLLKTFDWKTKQC